jgi:hypothetical protein
MIGATAAVRRTVLASLLLAMAPAGAIAQDRLQYRTYTLGDDLASVTLQAGLSVPAATDGPAAHDAVQELRWQARHARRGAAPTGDPVERLIFSFYEQRLFRIVIDYAGDRTAGMTEGDMVTAVSRLFGTPTRRIASPTVVGSAPGQPAAGIVAEWVFGDQSVALIALQDGTTFRMIVSSARDEALALAAGADKVPTDLPDWTSIGATRAGAASRNDTSGLERTRQANIAAFVP